VEKFQGRTELNQIDTARSFAREARGRLLTVGRRLSTQPMLRASRERMAGALRFFSVWMRSPVRTGSIVPSSGDLARKIVRVVRPGAGRVIELGGGTGVFTRALLDLGLPPAELEVVEIDPELVRGLRRQFRNVAILDADASDLVASVAGTAGDYQAVISGLPMLTIPRQQQRAILAAAFELLGDRGAFYQFTYATRPPLDPALINEFGLGVVQIDTSWRNFPPARIYRFTRRCAIACSDTA